MYMYNASSEKDRINDPNFVESSDERAQSIA